MGLSEEHAKRLLKSEFDLTKNDMFLGYQTVGRLMLPRIISHRVCFNIVYLDSVLSFSAFLDKTRVLSDRDPNIEKLRQIENVLKEPKDGFVKIFFTKKVGVTYRVVLFDADEEHVEDETRSLNYRINEIVKGKKEMSLKEINELLRGKTKMSLKEFLEASNE